MKPTDSTDECQRDKIVLFMVFGPVCNCCSAPIALIALIGALSKSVCTKEFKTRSKVKHVMILDPI